MDHGFVAVPEGLKGATEKKRITTIHETYFLHDRLPVSAQMTSTGPGHFQVNGLDIKYVTAGRGIQVNVRYNEKNEIMDVIVHEIKRGTWTAALPGYVDYMINLGGLRFNDISVSLTEKEAEAFREDWKTIKAAKIKPENAPVMAYYNAQGERIFVKKDGLDVEIREIAPDSFNNIFGRRATLVGTYLSGDLAHTEAGIAGLVEEFLEAKETAFERSTTFGLNRETTVADAEKQDMILSAGKKQEVLFFVDDNADRIASALKEERIVKLMRIPVEALQYAEENGVKGFLSAAAELGGIEIQFFSSSEPEKEVGKELYEEFGLKVPSLESEALSRSNVLTLLPVEEREEITWGDAPSKNWERLGKMPNGKLCGPKETIVCPVGYHYDRAGLVRSFILGLRLARIAEENIPADDIFVKHTLLQYRDFCLSMGSEKDRFDLTAEDIVNIACFNTAHIFSGALNKLIRLLPIAPLDIEEIRAVYERVREVLVKA